MKKEITIYYFKNKSYPNDYIVKRVLTQEENYKTFKNDTIIFNWVKLNDYGYKANTEVFIRKENISYYGIV